MRSFDVHQHLWPESFVAELRRRASHPRLEGSTLVTSEGVFEVDLDRHHPERRVDELDRDGIDIAVLSLQPSLGIEALPPAERDELEGAWSTGIAEIVASSAGRFRAFAPWRVEPGFVGTSVGASALLSEGGAAILGDVDVAGGVLFIHPEAGGPLPPGRPEWWQWTAVYTWQMQQAYLAWLGGLRARYPRVKAVFAMLAGGAPIQHERLVHRGVHVRQADDPATVFETSSYGRRALELCIETFGIERLVYGSDAPVVDPASTLAAVRSLGTAATRLLLSENAERLLHRTSTAGEPIA